MYVITHLILPTSPYLQLSTYQSASIYYTRLDMDVCSPAGAERREMGVQVDFQDCDEMTTLRRELERCALLSTMHAFSSLC